MLHWYRVARKIAYRHSHSADSCLVAEPPAQPTRLEGDGPDLTGSLSPQQRAKLFWLGLAEAAPLIASGVFGIYTDSKLQAVIAAPLAIVLTALLCWLLRHHVPPTRIELCHAKAEPST
jgi:hypothetical protein